MTRIIRRWFRLIKIWLAVQGLPVLEPKLYKSIRYAETQVRDATEMMRRRRGYSE